MERSRRGATRDAVKLRHPKTVVLHHPSRLRVVGCSYCRDISRRIDTAVIPKYDGFDTCTVISGIAHDGVVVGMRRCRGGITRPVGSAECPITDLGKGYTAVETLPKIHTADDYEAGVRRISGPN